MTYSVGECKVGVDPMKSCLLLYYIDIEVLFLELLIEGSHRRITLNNRVDHIISIDDMEEWTILFFTFSYDTFDSLFQITSEFREKETDMLTFVLHRIKEVSPNLIIIIELTVTHFVYRKDSHVLLILFLPFLYMFLITLCRSEAFF